MSSTCARVRLRFDQPPPLLFGSGPGAWLLVDMDSCRLVADLEFLIKRRFGMSRRRRLHLWLDGFLLPPTEKIAVVRDGDIIRRQKKRKVQTSEEEEDEPAPAKLRIQNKDTKRKKQKFNGSDSGVSTSSSAVPVPAKVASTKAKEVQKTQTKKREIQTSKGSAINGGKQSSTKTVKLATTKSRGKAKDSSSSSSSEDTSSSSEDTDSDSSSSDSSSTSSDTSKEVKPRSSLNVNTKTCNRPGLVSKPQQRKNKPDSSSDTGTSSSDSSSSDTDGDVSVNKQTQSRQAAVGIPEQRHSNPIEWEDVLLQCRKGFLYRDSRLSLELENNNQLQAVTSIKGRATGSPSKGHIVFDTDSESDSGSSGTGGERTVFQIRRCPPPVPHLYLRTMAFPPLHGPPRVGDRIAYKILEMSANYCPEISSYKEAVVTGYDPSSGDLQLDMVYDITAYMRQNQPGRFEMDVDLEEQEDKTDNKVTVAVSALVEPKLVQG
ncbi:hypothetical protein Bbelb_348200 [Branchiostoma belcheri]|nr:hypothetical protein Bbelb_348200 [Branchiostoma belcheri]